MGKFDIYAIITNRIIEELEQGIIPWEKPWAGVHGGAVSGVTGQPYSLLNQMLLRRPGEYLTFNQVNARGGRVRKGAKSQMIVFWKQVKVTEQNENGESVEQLIPMLRTYNVFHVDQCDGLPERKPVPVAEQPPIQSGEDILSQYQHRERVTIQHIKGDRACYSPASDKITLPLREQFKSPAEYYSTVFHEVTHSTGHAKRLNRLKIAAHFGDEAYSKEELVAEIGAAALMSHTGAETRKSFRNNAAYVQNWLNALRGDSRMIVQASGLAAKAVEFVLTGK